MRNLASVAYRADSGSVRRRCYRLSQTTGPETSGPDQACSRNKHAGGKPGKYPGTRTRGHEPARHGVSTVTPPPHQASGLVRVSQYERLMQTQTLRCPAGVVSWDFAPLPDIGHALWDFAPSLSGPSPHCFALRPLPPWLGPLPLLLAGTGAPLALCGTVAPLLSCFLGALAPLRSCMRAAT